MSPSQQLESTTLHMYDPSCNDVCFFYFQEDHWKIEPYRPPEEVSIEDKECEDSDSGESFSADAFDSSQEEMTEEMMETLMDPLTKVNTWEKTRLGRLISFFYASRQTHKP